MYGSDPWYLDDQLRRFSFPSEWVLPGYHDLLQVLLYPVRFDVEVNQLFKQGVLLHDVWWFNFPQPFVSFHEFLEAMLPKAFPLIVKLFCDVIDITTVVLRSIGPSTTNPAG